MKLDKIVAWYQRKISTYDKQQWEITVEQRILNGFIHAPLKSTKLKTELIDVDLVRGSSFPKAKPKQSLLTVLRLSCLRFLFLPIYARWWVEQTSLRIFSILLTLYLAQMFNWGVYSYNLHRIEADTEHIVSITELLVPMGLSLILCTIHSQIVATASNKSTVKSRNRVLFPEKRKCERMRRRRKVIRIRSTTADPNKQFGPTVLPSRTETRPAQYETNNLGTNHKEVTTPNKEVGELKTILTKKSLNIVSTECDKIDELRLKDKLKIENIICDKFGWLEDGGAAAATLDLPTGIRKRNVNWDASITKRQNMTKHLSFNNLLPEHQHIGSVSPINRRLHQGENSPEANYVQGIVAGADDDGFESLNGKSSSGEDNISINRSPGIFGRNARWFHEAPDMSPQDFSNSVKIPSTQINEQPQDTLASSQETKSSNFEVDINKANSFAAFKTKINKTNSFCKSVPSSDDTDDEGDVGDTTSSTLLHGAGDTSPGQTTEVTASATEWIAITTNSEDCSSEIDHSDSQFDLGSENGGEYDFAPTNILNPGTGSGDRISCTIWHRRETKKAEMSVLDISSAIIERVEAMPENCDYVYIGLALSIMLSLVPAICRLCEATVNTSNSTEMNFLDMPVILLERTSFSYITMGKYAFGESAWEKVVLILSLLLRICLTFIFFFLLAVAERTFKQRFLYAKLFSHLTSSRRARKSEVPHFRLNKVRNIKIWLSVRSYLKRRGPQRSVDVIVSTAFILTLLFLAFLSVEWLKDSVHLHSQYNLEALIWSCALGCFLLRFMTLGTKINRKYRSISVLITEQINLYLQIEQKPQKKEELMVSNSVLKLAADLLKELESPFKISGLSANPYLYTTVKVVILSALSGVLSEMLGFKLKLHKIKIK